MPKPQIEAWHKTNERQYARRQSAFHWSCRETGMGGVSHRWRRVFVFTPANKIKIGKDFLIENSKNARTLPLKRKTKGGI